jgi:beta-lactamase class D
MLQRRAPARSRVELSAFAFALVFVTFVASCRSTVSPAPRTDDAMRAFAQRGVDGSFVLMDDANGATIVLNGADAERATIPCSTFKIPNTLIGLETGVIPDEHFALPWDGRTRAVAAWNHDHDVRTALRDSVVWFYQEVARRIGEERMREWVRRLGYGNARVDGAIDAFWLDDGSLRITPREQVDFLRRLRTYALPVERRHVDVLIDVLPIDRRADFVLHAKTGLGIQAGRAVGWYVGYAERGSRRWTFATRLDAPAGDLERIAPLRKDITYELLARYANR